jgi:hypothetical protein
MCTKLATQINGASKGRVSVVPLYSDEAKYLLKQFYPSGYPFTYFLIESHNNHSKVWQGSAAALRLARHLSVPDSVRVLGRYLHYRASGNRFTHSLVRMSPFSAPRLRPPGRREFLRAAIAGGVVLVVGGLVSRFPLTQSMGPKASLVKLPPIELPKSMLIDGKAPNHLVLSPSGEVVEVYNESRTVPYSPDCACIGCSCCPIYDCCRCVIVSPEEVECTVCCQDCNGYYHCSVIGYSCDPGTCCYGT